MLLSGPSRGPSLSSSSFTQLGRLTGDGLDLLSTARPTNYIKPLNKGRENGAFKSGDNHTIDGVVSVYSETSVLPEI